MRIIQHTIDSVKSVSTLELATRMGDNPKQIGSSFQVYCPNPAHHEKTPDTYIQSNMNGWKCFGGGGCGAQGSDAIKYYAWRVFGSWDPKQHFVDSVVGIANLMGISITEEGSKRNSRRAAAQSQRVQTSFKAHKFEEVEARDADTCDRIYRKFLQMCPIYRDHAEEWLGPKRQYTKEHVLKLGLRSVPATSDEISSIIQKLQEDGESLERIPGFTQRLKQDGDPSNEKDWYWTLSVNRGYFIPVRDELGRIVRMRVATNGKPKYIWFSSAPNIQMETDPERMRKGGAPSGAPLNIVVPAQQLALWTPGTDITDIFRMDVVIGTEGEHKSAIASNRLQMPVIGVPGVGNFKEVIPTIQRWGTKKFIIAYDTDSLYKEEEINGRNEEVFKQLVRFSQELLKLGIEVVIWTWNASDGKGLDDLLIHSSKLPVEIDLRTGQRQPVVLSA
ncbi:DUF3854 domain-containing protein [Ammoniphilus resinae]|uniref:DUF3854 domain-containing protein n=1 Tax=Ammoniphilus resinae TaxID=861532 RepID=A0ABS4GPJ4_9BACL|nr:DUF3854 domain-containing protein [Ammoniphilus resinae]MBP1931780.1 hypothetical protein [Ammoniphilus resinae]